VNGKPVRTDEMAQGRLALAIAYASANEQSTFTWVYKDGSIASLASADLIALADAVHAYVEGVFAKLSTAIAGINNGTITTWAQVDACFDPVK
jgi:Domain of unknown function (DUF4376)